MLCPLAVLAILLLVLHVLHTTCTRVLEAELSSEALQTTASPQPPASPRSELGERDSTPISVVDSSTSKQHSPTPTAILPDESSREYFQETEYEGTSYRVGDIVYVTARYSAHECHSSNNTTILKVILYCDA